MKKAYEKPEVKMISLLIPEKIATFGDVDIDAEGEFVDGDTAVESSIFGN